ncbi:hypothetical protein [Marinifilum flexuosum]|uniref:Uncharacterized protein n=1 Tax=Marinifilum flexuosum TaxID=1117708 RepID=A0A419X3R6_9BACT|nr:hypothetical protein [Marinifilum flexuosum]RKE02365.1 hypothetical protein BXY64_2453 [Marinifilum flexuosum]
MKKFLPLLFICIITITTGFCTDKSTQKANFPNYGVLQYFVPSQNVTSFNLKPSLYLSEKFLPGKIITCNKNIITPNGIRYNIAEDEIECQINTQYSRISSPHKINEVEINGNQYVYKKHIHKGDSVSGYLQMIHSGQKNLYVKYYLNEAKYPYSKCNIRNVFYVEKADGFPQKVRSLKAEILSIYKNQASYANSFMKSNNYQWNDSKALVQLVNYLEKLTASSVASR